MHLLMRTSFSLCLLTILFLAACDSNEEAAVGMPQTRVAFSTLSDGNMQLFVQHVDGSNRARVSLNGIAEGFTRQRQNGAFVRPLPSDANLVGVSDFEALPRSNRLVAVARSGVVRNGSIQEIASEVILFDLGGQGGVTLSPDLTAADGSILDFIPPRSQWRLAEVNPSHPTISPDGRQVAYTLDVPLSRGVAICAVEVESFATRCYDDKGGSNGSSLSLWWSSDGEAVYYFGPANVRHRLDMTTGEETTFTYPSPDARGDVLDFDPETGEMLSYLLSPSADEGGRQVIRTDESGARTVLAEDAYWAAYEDGGSRIVIYRSSAVGGFEYVLMSPDGTDVQPLGLPSTVVNRPYVWTE